MESLANIGLIDKIVAGCDEAGRGPLAGPVFAAAVIMPNDFEHPLIRDSKKLSKKQRLEAIKIIKENAIAWAIASCSAQEIDERNILRASIFAMQKAVVALYGSDLSENVGTIEDKGGKVIQPEFLLIDGNKFYDFKDKNGITVPYKTIVKGDSLYTSIAAASILAKTYRDDLMISLSKEYPQFGWDRNMAYPTAEHRAAILKYGITPYHRKTFVHIQKELFK